MGRGALESAVTAGDGQAHKPPREAGVNTPKQVRPVCSIYPRRETTCLLMKHLACDFFFFVWFGFVTRGLGQAMQYRSNVSKANESGIRSAQGLPSGERSLSFTATGICSKFQKTLHDTD